MNLATSEPNARHPDDPHLEALSRCADDHGALSHLFFSDNDVEIAESKGICRTCGVQQSCLDGAIERAEPYGVWGGQLMRDGVPIARRPRRGRPRRFNPSVVDGPSVGPPDPRLGERSTEPDTRANIDGEAHENR